MLSGLEAGTSSATYQVDTALADIEDMLSYCNDILLTGVSCCSRPTLLPLPFPPRLGAHQLMHTSPSLLA